jgi:hypothetical protein
VAKITKMQQRRGLRRDLPLPLAPGEFGLATDSRELFIGNDVTDSLSGIQNRTIQLGFFATGFDFTNSHLQNNITEFIVKRDVITGVTGIGPTPSTGFSILSVHSGLSATAAHASGVKLAGGINDQSLTVHKYSPATSSHAKLIPGDPDGAPVTVNDYKLIGGVGTLGIQFAKALVATDVIYVVHLTKKDLETYLINAFNASYDTPAGGGTALTNLTQVIDLSQLYFDQSTGESFVGFNDAQIPKADNSTNVPNAGVATSSSNKSVKEWFDEYLIHASSKLNGAISGLGNAYWGNGDGTTVNISNDGGKGVAKFGTDVALGDATDTTVPVYSMDEDLTFATRSHIGAKNLSMFLNQSWLAEGSNPLRQLSHLRSNIRVVTDENVGDVFSNLTIGNPSTRTVSDTTSPGSSSTNPIQGTQVYRAVGSVYTTTQALVGVVRYDLTSISNIEIDYSVKFTDSVGSPTYYVTRVGRASVGFPLVNGANVKGHGAILDQWNEMDALSTTGAVAAFSAIQTFEFATVVARRVTTKGDPVLEQDYDDSVANTGGTGTAAYTTKYGEVHGSSSYVDVDNSTKYFGFLLYKNLRGVDGTIEFIQRRF